jgi:hypothetical protein
VLRGNRGRHVQSIFVRTREKLKDADNDSRNRSFLLVIVVNGYFVSAVFLRDVIE